MKIQSQIFHSQKIKWLLFLIVTSVVSLLNIFCNSTSKQNVVSLTDYASLNDTVKYVGMDVCKQCHYEIYSSYIETGMGKSFEVASKNKSAASFKDASIFDKYLNFHYNASWINNELHFNEYRLQHADTLYRRSETIGYIIGSGQHTNSHEVNFNGYVYQAPMTYYTQKQKWDFPPGFENGFNSRFSRAIGLECMTCHNAFPKFVLGSENKYDHVPNGIDCERCHGPGEVHVKLKQQGEIVDTSKYIDYSIVNPAKLSIEKQFDVCQRCHIQGNVVLNKGKSFFDFKPGMSLSSVMNAFMPVYSGNENEHIMASHAERLKLSNCYLSTSAKVDHSKTDNSNLHPYKNALTCITCHNPHKSVKVTENEIFNNACKSCHEGSGKKYCSESKIQLTLNNNNCIKCHMPANGATDIPHVSVTDHFIRKPMKQSETDKIKKFVTIACINNQQVDDKTKGRAYINYYEKFNLGSFALDSAKKYFDDSDANLIRVNFEELVHIAYLKEDYNLIIKYCNTVSDVLHLLSKKSFDNADAHTAYRIAQSFENIGEFETAEVYYEKVIALAPFHLEYLNKYGSILTQLNKLNEAKKIFTKIISENPKYPQGWCNLGFVSLKTENNFEFALNCYNKALALNPDYEQAVINKAGLLLLNNDATEAKILLKQFIKSHPKSIQVIKTLEIINSSLQP